MIDYSADLLVKILHYLSTQAVRDESLSYDELQNSLLRQILFLVDGHTMTEPNIDRELEHMSRWIQDELTEEGGFPAVGKEENPSYINAFHLIDLLHLKLLDVYEGEVIYHYKYLRIWDRLNREIGSDLLIAGKYAWYDGKHGIQRKAFPWNENLRHDNHQLNQILDLGMPENHCHLGGASPYFLLSWISLMNSVTNSRYLNFFQKIDQNPRNPVLSYQRKYAEESYQTMHLQAALIRVYLYSCMANVQIQLGACGISVEKVLLDILDWEDIRELYQHRCAECSLMIGDYIYIQDYLEAVFKPDEENYIRRKCPIFYYFFWREYQDLPVRILPDSGYLVVPGE